MEKKWLYLILFFIISNGILVFWSKSFLVSHNPLETLVSQTMGGLPILTAIVVYGKKSLKISKKDHALTLLDGIAVFLSVTFFYQIIKSGQMTIVLPVLTITSTIIITLIGLVFYKEAQMFKREKLLGLVLGIVGVGLLVI